ncbi:MAG: Stp1/IreP family PP2C-type Ser/Thr phosphatase [Acidimicrobiales bacterium]|nr:Stp1/IreP family PP2C-type Ser/Thr phosphatase [Acidimicrobiales bacterium]
MTTLRAGGATHVGQVRSNNQDSYLVKPDADLYGVADGMGGHNGGEVASEMAVELLEANAGDPSLDNLMEAARIGNRAIFERAGADVDLHGMGTTLCAVRVVPGADEEGDEVAWINVGDSRVYLFRDDGLIQLSRDHSLVEDLLRDGQLTEEEAKVHPKRNIITRALGIDVDVEVDGATVIPFNGDRFVLCSDGLFGEVTEDQIASVLRRLADPTEAAEELVRLANEAGGRDNITVVVVEVVDDDGRAEAASAALAAAEASKLAAREAEDAEAADGEEDGEGLTEAAEVTEPYVDAFAGRRSSLPEPDDDYAAEVEDLYSGMEGLDAKRLTWRVAVFVAALVAISIIVVGSLVYFDRQSYRVALDGGDAVIYRGNPNGFLWLDAPVEDRAEVDVDELSTDERRELAGEPSFKTLDAARIYLSQLAIASQTTTTTTTTTTTAPVTTTSTTAPTTTTAPSNAPTTTPGP